MNKVYNKVYSSDGLTLFASQVIISGYFLFIVFITNFHHSPDLELCWANIFERVNNWIVRERNDVCCFMPFGEIFYYYKFDISDTIFHLLDILMGAVLLKFPGLIRKKLASNSSFVIGI